MGERQRSDGVQRARAQLRRLGSVLRTFGAQVRRAAEWLLFHLRNAIAVCLPRLRTMGAKTKRQVDRLTPVVAERSTQAARALRPDRLAPRFRRAWVWVVGLWHRGRLRLSGPEHQVARRAATIGAIAMAVIVVGGVAFALGSESGDKGGDKGRGGSAEQPGPGGNWQDESSPTSRGNTRTPRATSPGRHPTSAADQDDDEAEAPPSSRQARPTPTDRCRKTSYIQQLSPYYLINEDGEWISFRLVKGPFNHMRIDVQTSDDQYDGRYELTDTFYDGQIEVQMEPGFDSDGMVKFTPYLVVCGPWADKNGLLK